MIIIKKLTNFKYLGVFFLIELLLAFIMGLLNLMGVSSSLILILDLIINIGLFIFFGFKKGLNTNKKGLVEGAITGSLMCLTLFVISFIFFLKKISGFTLIYYLILILSSSLSSMVAKNKSMKEDRK